MTEPRPAPGEELNPGRPTTPRLAATVMLLRGADAALEVLLVRRNPAARFMGGAWVFPGGAVRAEDGQGEPARRRAAVRELEEEAGISLAPDAELVPFARWITPAQVRIRFDTWFYLAAAPAGARATPDGGEVIGARWYAPARALEAGAQGELSLVFPTIKQLEQLAAFPSAGALLDHARGQDVRPVQPQVVGSAETARIVLPGEPGYVGDGPG
jgi:8-oxo-dGTP pyrophosphatase MutT (NUDIX family)